MPSAVDAVLGRFVHQSTLRPASDGIVAVWHQSATVCRVQTAGVHKRDYLLSDAGAFWALFVVALALARPCDQVEDEQMSDALRERFGYEHPILRGRGDGVQSVSASVAWRIWSMRTGSSGS